jgi:rod shape determining protein RodA
VIARVDRLQVLLAAMLAAIGVTTVFSAGADWPHQLVWLGLGAVAYIAAVMYDYRRLPPLAPALFLVTLVLLVAVHLAGHAALGARRWLSIAGFPLEPSELSKLLLVVVLAGYLARDERVSWRSFGGALGLVAAPAALVLVQPDLGTTIVLLVVALGMLFVAGARPAQLAAVVTAGVVAVPLLPHLLHGYQRRRLEIFLDPSRDPLGAGYNLLQARIAVGAGGLFGRGWLHGLQGQLGFVPERATDFVFATYAEEFGLLGSVLLLAVFGLLLLRLLRTASVASDRFGEMVAGGVFVMVLAQVTENVGMNIGVLPIAGIPLPLISYGGSATITTLAALGLVQSVMVRRRTIAFERREVPVLGTIPRRAQA